MTTSRSHEELMKNQDHAAWDLNGTFVDENPNKTKLECLWHFLNSKLSNIAVVFLTLIQGIIILVTLLIDLKVIQDPLWTQTCNESTSGNEFNSGVDHVLLHASNSTNISTVRNVFKYITLTIISIFTFEIFDALVVSAAFALCLAFLSAPKDGRDAALFVVLLRLWRIKRVFQSLINNTKRQMTHVLNAYKRDKIQAEHKVELLILKVEDLEHEVAYLKEKVKKYERESGTNKKLKKSGYHLLPNNSNGRLQKENPLPLQQRLPPEGRTESPSKDPDVGDLYKFADTTVKAILRTASNELGSREKWQHTKSLRDDKGLSPLQFQLKPISQNENSNKANDNEQLLDELSEIERIRSVEFDPSRKHEDIPITVL